MSYGRSKANALVGVDQVRWLTEVLELEMTPEELEALTAAFSNQLAAIQVMERFELKNFPPLLKFDASWHD